MRTTYPLVSTDDRESKGLGIACTHARPDASILSRAACYFRNSTMSGAIITFATMAAG